MKETLEAKKARAREIIKRLNRALPDAKIALVFKTPLELLVAVILSAQCTDKRVNLVTPALFKKYKAAQDYAKAGLHTLEQLIHSTGFYRAKARNIRNCARELVKRFRGKIPNRMEDLVTLPGVGRKTANVILGNTFGIPGLVVDTHMIRLANRLGFTSQKDPVKIELELNEIVPRKDWTQFSHLIIHHGRRTCVARKPKCEECSVSPWCPSRGNITKTK